MHKLLCAFLLAITIAGCTTQKATSPAEQRANNVRNSFGTYAAAPRLENRHTDIGKLIGELDELNANTYNWLVRNSHEWEDLKAFLPVARKKHLKVWVTLIPPSEPPLSQPFGLDFERWAKEIAQLSLSEPNLVAWSLDDFPYNQKVFTPERMTKIINGARQINPKLAFIPCCYFQHYKPGFIAAYQGLFDAVIFPYRAQSVGSKTLTDASHVESEIKTLRARLGPNTPVIVVVYASAHSTFGKSTPEYVEQVMLAGMKSADGVMVYCHQPRNSEKYEVIKKVFARRNN